MKILIIGGFLGSGKTSIILQIAKYLTRQKKKLSNVVILENEIGEAGIDNKMIADTGVCVKTVFSGCVCCTLSGKLINNIQYIQNEMNPEWIIIETTGMAYPYKVKEIIKNFSHQMEIRLICIVDAKRWERMQKIPELHEFSKEQLKEAEYIFINKCDLVSVSEKHEVECSVKTISKQARIMQVSAYEEIDKEIWKMIFMAERE